MITTLLLNAVKISQLFYSMNLCFRTRKVILLHNKYLMTAITYQKIMNRFFIIRRFFLRTSKQSYHQFYSDLRSNVPEPCKNRDMVAAVFKALTYLPNSCYYYISLHTFAMQRNIYKRITSVLYWFVANTLCSYL